LFALVILCIVYLLIAIRRFGRFNIPLWLPMLAGGLLVVVGGAISPTEAFYSVDWNILLFLFCMFVVIASLEKSGYLEEWANRIFSTAKNPKQLLLFVILFSGASSAILMNDTIALVGVPLLIYLARVFQIKPIPLLMALAFSVTIGSTMSPIGNPQNLLIALSGGIAFPFISFLKYLFIPTAINLAICYFILSFFYKTDLTDFQKSSMSCCMVRDRKLARISKFSVLAMGFLILIDIVSSLFNLPFNVPLPLIALAGASIVIIFSSRRLEMVRKVDYETLLFFFGMFILMKAVWNEGIIQSFLANNQFALADTGTILAFSTIASQFLSNVPFVMLYLPLIAGAGEKAFIALAAGSTLAGNLTLLGAASNVIIVQNAEKRGVFISFFEFLKAGIVLTLINVAVVFAFLLI